MTISAVSEAVAIGCVLILGSLASGAGVGGGALYIPLFVLLLSPDKLAIPLSKACAFGASIALFLRNSSKSRAGSGGVGSRPLIDYQMALLLEPFTLVGTMLGVRLNKLLPFSVLATIMAILMTFISIKTFHRAMSLHRAEQGIRRASETTSLLSPSIVDASNDVGDEINEDHDASRIVIEEERQQFPKFPIFMLIIYWIIGVIPAVLVNCNYDGKFDCFSRSYFVVMIGSIVLLFLLALVNAVRLIKFASIRQRALRLRPRTDPTEPHWTVKNVSILSLVSLLAGILSALVGVGGSTIKGPFLVHIVPPEVASSTAAFMLLSTCSASMLQFILMGMLDYRLAVLFFIAGFIAAFFGSKFWAIIIASLKKRSLIVFLLAAYVALATIAMTVLSIYEIESHHVGRIDSFC